MLVYQDIIKETLGIDILPECDERATMRAFCRALKIGGCAVADKKVLLLCTDGGEPYKSALSALGAERIATLDPAQNADTDRDADIIINTTDIGTSPYNRQPPPVALADFPNCKFVFDTIYSPCRTPLLLAAGDAGIKNANGLALALIKADPDLGDEDIILAAKTVTLKTRNILLVGMPACGKTAVGRALADALGREFEDINEEVAAGTNTLAIYDLVGHESEQFFRWYEGDICAKASNKRGAVIAAGGSALLHGDNFAVLRQNAYTVILSRDEDKTDARTLRNGQVLRAAYRAAMPEFTKTCDTQIDNNGSIADAVNNIIGEFTK